MWFGYEDMTPEWHRFFCVLVLLSGSRTSVKPTYRHVILLGAGSEESKIALHWRDCSRTEE